jgi:hypothetical protein
MSLVTNFRNWQINPEYTAPCLFVHRNLSLFQALGYNKDQTRPFLTEQEVRAARTSKR